MNKLLLALLLIAPLIVKAQDVPIIWEGHVKGIGGVFFKVEDPDAVLKWYEEHLGIPAAGPGYAHFAWRDYTKNNEVHRTIWTPFPRDADAFGKPEQQVMINYIVDDLAALLAKLEASGIEQIGEVESFPYGQFAWILDLEGNKVEFWQPVIETD